MKNRQRFLTLLLLLAAPGCSADYGFDTPEPVSTDPVWPPPLPEPETFEPSEAELVSSLSVENVTIEFFVVPTPGDEIGALPDGTIIAPPGASVLIVEHGSPDSGQPVAEVRQSLAGGVTSAELWIGLTGTPELLPSRLANLQAYEAWQLGRESVALADVRRSPLDPYELKAGGWDDQGTFLQPIAGFLQTNIQLNSVAFGGALSPSFFSCTGRTSNISHIGTAIGATCQQTLRTGWVRIGIANTRAAVGTHPGLHGPADFHVDPYYSGGTGIWVAMSRMALAPRHWTVWGWNVPQQHGLALSTVRWSASSEHTVRFFTSTVNPN